MDGARMTTLEIKKIRERLNLTQVEFAERLGVCQGTISLWERGERHPTGSAVRLMQLLCDAETVSKKTSRSR